MRKPEKTGLAFVSYLCVLGLFTLYVLLDTFVIARGYTQVETAQKAAQAHEPVVTDASYDDGLLSVSIRQIRAYDSTVHVAEVKMADVSALRTAFAQNTYGRNVVQRTSEMAAQNNAVLAVNGDYYGAQRSGYVIRNGALYRGTKKSASQEDACIWPDGSMTIIREGDVTAQALLEAGAQQVFSFGPGLLENGEIIVTEEDEVGRAMASNPRTAIAMIEPLHYLVAVADGRTYESEGLSLLELAQVLRELGAQVAYNLDGGGSSTMVFMGEVINYPTTNGRYREREVSDIVWF